MGNYSTSSFPDNRWVDGDVLSDLDSAFASIDAAIRHAFGFSVNVLVSPFDIADDGSIVVQTSIAIGTSNAMIDIIDLFPGGAEANEDKKLANVDAIRRFLSTQTIPAGRVVLDTASFNNILGALDDEVQHAMDTLDDHSHDMHWLSDVTITSISDGQILEWDNGAGGWINVNQGSGGGVLDHGNLTGLDGDDHAQYILGSRVSWTDLTDGGVTTLHTHANIGTGPWLPLTAGKEFPLTGNLHLTLATSEPLDGALANGEAVFWYQ